MSEALGQRVRGWATTAVIFAVGVAGFNLLFGWLPDAWDTPVVIALVVLPSLLLWVLSGRTLYTIIGWYGPALLFVGLAWAYLPDRWFAFALLPLGLVLWASTCTEVGWRVCRAYLNWLGGLLAFIGLPAGERSTYRRLMKLLRASGVKRAAARLGGLTTPIRAFRDPAEEVRRIVPPDPEWASVIQLSAQPGLVYADMLEGKRPMDTEAVVRLARERDDRLHVLLRARSPLYRLMTVKLDRPRHDSSQA